MSLVAGENIDITAHQNLQLSMGCHIAMNVARGFGVFALDGGITHIAHRGTVLVQAQHDTVRLQAEQDVEITASKGCVRVAAKEMIELVCGGAYIKIANGNIELGMPEDFTVKAASRKFTGPASQQSSLPGWLSGVLATISSFATLISPKLAKSLTDIVAGFVAEHFGLCIAEGHPVNVATGAMFTSAEDFRLDGLLTLAWSRIWMSGSNHNGSLGYGWHHPYDWALSPWETHGWVARLGDGRLAIFAEPTPDAPAVNPVERLILRVDDAGRYEISDYNGVSHSFTPAPVSGQTRLLSSIHDANGNAIHFTRAPDGRLEAIMDSAGRTLTVHSDTAGRITAIDAPHPDQPGEYLCLVAYRYDESGDLIQATDARGAHWDYVYDRHLMVAERHRGGLCYRFVWDDAQSAQAARCIETWGEPPKITITNPRHQGLNYAHLTYDVPQGKTSVTTGRGASKTYHWNEHGRVEYIRDALDGEHRRWFDDAGQITRQTHPDGRVESFIYDALGRLEQHNLPNGTKAQIAYASNDPSLPGLANPEEVIAPDGQTHRFRYDARGNLLESLGPDGVKRQITRDACGLPLLISNELGPIANYRWSEKGELLSAGPEKKTQISYSHDALGRVVKLQRAEDAPLYLERDANGNPINIRRGRGGQGRVIDLLATLAYDPEDRLISHHDAFNRETSWHYNGLPCLLRKRAADGTITRYGYDSELNLTEVHNEKGEIYHLEYDLLDRLCGETGYDGRKREYHRDGSGFVRSVVDQDRITEYRRDPLGQVVQIHFAGGEVIHDFAWDAGGRLIRAATPDRVVNFTYDAAGRLIGEAQDDQIITHQRDLRGRMVATTLPDGRRQELIYDSGSNVTRIRFAGQDLARFSHDAAGREITRQTGNLEQKQIFDPQGRLVAQESQVFSRSYAYDDVDQLIRQQDKLFGNKEYIYDACNRLLSVDGLEPERFTFDPTGLLLSSQTRIISGSRPTAATAQGNRLLQSGNATRFAYDAWGNRAAEKRPDGKLIEYQYNAYDQLITVATTIPGRQPETTRFAYDALGRRIWKETNGLRTDFLWNGNVLLAESTDSSDPLACVYLSEPASFRPLAQSRRSSPKSPATLYHYHLDHLGTPREMTNSQGEIVWAADLKSWGAIARQSVNKIDNPLRFQGQYHDIETGLHYNRFRYYSPREGAYLQQDQIGLAGGMNLYAYAEGNSLGYIDLQGLSPSNDPIPIGKCPDNVRNFFKELDSPLTDLAKDLNVDSDSLKALSAFESGWYGHHAQEFHNIFGLTHGGKSNLEFKSMDEGINSFKKNAGNKIRGSKNINDLIVALEKPPAYNSERKNYYDDLRKVYKSEIKYRKNCGYQK